MKRTHLRKDNDKTTVNSILRFMMKDNRPIGDICHHVNGIFQTNWSKDVVKKKIRDLHQSKPIPKPPPPLTVIKKVNYKRNPIVALAKLKTTRKMPLGQLCEHTASFFEPVANAARNQDTNEEWKIAKDKVELWNSIRQFLGTEKLSVLIGQLTESESIAYSYCDRLFYLKNRKSTKKEYGGVYGLYRQWRAAYLDS